MTVVTIALALRTEPLYTIFAVYAMAITRAEVVMALTIPQTRRSTILAVFVVEMVKAVQVATALQILMKPTIFVESVVEAILAWDVIMSPTRAPLCNVACAVETLAALGATTYSSLASSGINAANAAEITLAWDATASPTAERLMIFAISVVEMAPLAWDVMVFPLLP